MQHTKLKIYSSAFLVISFLTYCIWLCYRIWHGTFLGLLNDEDYIYYDWKGVPIFLSLPGIVYGYLLCWCRILPFNKITIPFLLRFLNYVTTYLFAALVIGIILSMVVSFGTLGSGYYKCNSTSVVSSGSYYAKSNAICKKRKYSH